MQISGPHPQKFWFRVYVGPEKLIFNKFPGDTDVTAPGATLWGPLHCLASYSVPGTSALRPNLSVKCYRSAFLL